ncbi:hypothetical protein HG263_04540 [Pseudoalteromonas sp. JBTF-M23]|uniref:WD40 repeat protein n=1 Tax=Pseudoalteromonas caenipelagi TaxID=2726988 RepID=A0A849V8Z2_9GAMM|nr:PD40 domain-containing protein [Pseudoalteromonas caenipelagi]NOU49802.1 hypothetical protein [Pseudoalteromonas caenipelagi]
MNGASRLVLLCLLIVSGCGVSQEAPDQKLTGPYLGQMPPGATPIAFAPEIVSTQGWEVSGVFTPDLLNFYYIRRNKQSQKQEIVEFKNINGYWHERVFSARNGTPLFSPSGDIMYLGKRFRKRTDSGWSELQPLGGALESWPIMRLSASANGTVFFDEFKQDLTGDIRFARLVDGQYQAPQLLNKLINTGRSFHPFIAPDESYLIFDSKRENGFGDSDLYISYKQKEGTWGAPINLGEKINTNAWEALASVTPDGKYLFFNRQMSQGGYGDVDIFWVSADIIEQLKPAS